MQTEEGGGGGGGAIIKLAFDLELLEIPNH